jgi:hypothetical protein
MLAYGTETLEAKDFVRTGLVLTVIALALVMLLGTTYWSLARLCLSEKAMRIEIATVIYFQ